MDNKQETFEDNKQARLVKELANELKSKQETLEEATEKYWEANKYKSDYPHCPFSFQDGAKWQAERMYTEKEVIKISKLAVKEFLETNNFEITYDYQREVFKEFLLTHNEWFEQFKKK